MATPAYIKNTVFIIQDLHINLDVLVRPLGAFVEQTVAQTQVHIMADII